MTIADRRRGRECALQVLFMLEFDDDPDRAFGAYGSCADADATGEPGASDAAREFCERLVRGVWAERDALDRRIQDVSRHWRVARMSRVDRNVLRLAAWELLSSRDAPARVVLDEAIEIARRFGAEGSASFVNGVLDALARQEDAR